MFVFIKYLSLYFISFALMGCGSMVMDESSDSSNDFVSALQIIGSPNAVDLQSAVQGALQKPRQWQRKRQNSGPLDPDQVRVWLFSSLASQAHLMKLGADPSTGIRMWENYLNLNRISFVRISSASEIDNAKTSGVLILPSTVIMSEFEKQAVAKWRERGGSVLSTWLTAAYTTSGESAGFSFMRDVLDVEVAGNTEDEVEDTYMVLKGDNPISNSAAGLRVWLERVPNQYPLRLIGKHEAAYIMSWSRTVGAEKPAGLIAFNERRMSPSVTSRSITLGYPEQNWLRSDTQHISAIIRGALSWLFREPHAYVSSWPSPFGSAILFAIQAAEPLGQNEIDMGADYRKLGGLATYYLLGSNIHVAAPSVKKILAQGHEVGFHGDVFESFDKQPESKQLERFVNMRKQFESANIKIQEPFSFSTPMNGYDSTTRRLLVEQNFGSYLSFMELTESTLPFIDSKNSDGYAKTVVIPRTLISPEEITMELGPEDGMKSFLKSLDMSTKMGGVSVINLPSENLIPPEERKRLMDFFSDAKGEVWLASAREISQWWGLREGVSAILERDPQGYTLTASVSKSISSENSIGIWINLPRLDAKVQISGPKGLSALQPVLIKDKFRALVTLKNLPAGQSTWSIVFN